MVLNMATYLSAQYKDGQQTPTPTDMCVAPHRAYFVFPASTVLAIGDVIVLSKIAPTYGIHGATIDTDAMAGLSVDAGFLNTANTAVTSKTHNAVSLATAGVINPNATGALRAEVVDDARGFGLIVTAGATVPLGFTVGVNLELRPRQPVE